MLLTEIQQDPSKELSPGYYTVVMFHHRTIFPTITRFVSLIDRTTRDHHRINRFSEEPETLRLTTDKEVFDTWIKQQRLELFTDATQTIAAIEYGRFGDITSRMYQLLKKRNLMEQLPLVKRDIERQKKAEDLNINKGAPTIFVYITGKAKHFEPY